MLDEERTRPWKLVKEQRACWFEMSCCWHTEKYEAVSKAIPEEETDAFSRYLLNVGTILLFDHFASWRNALHNSHHCTSPSIRI